MITLSQPQAGPSRKRPPMNGSRPSNEKIKRLKRDGSTAASSRSQSPARRASGLDEGAAIAVFSSDGAGEGELEEEEEEEEQVEEEEDEVLLAENGETPHPWHCFSSAFTWRVENTGSKAYTPQMKANVPCAPPSSPYSRYRCISNAAALLRNAPPTGLGAGIRKRTGRRSLGGSRPRRAKSEHRFCPRIGI